MEFPEVSAVLPLFNKACGLAKEKQYATEDGEEGYWDLLHIIEIVEWHGVRDE